jgi:hypothetical protein
MNPPPDRADRPPSRTPDDDDPQPPSREPRVREPSPSREPVTREPNLRPGDRNAETQRAALFETDGDRPVRRSRGSALWRMQQITTRGNEDVAIRAAIEIPERGLGAELSLRRNFDPSLPATHTIEIRFHRADISQVSSVRSILMREADGARGMPLAGVAVRSSPGVFLVGLSKSENEAQRNLRLLRDGNTMDITFMLENGTRAVLSVDKGAPGARIFEEAMTRWASPAVTQQRPEERHREPAETPRYREPSRVPPPTTYSPNIQGGSRPASRH